MPKRILLQSIPFREARIRLKPDTIVAITLPWINKKDFWKDEHPVKYTGESLDAAWTCQLQFGIDKGWNEDVMCHTFREMTDEEEAATEVEKPLSQRIFNILDSQEVSGNKGILEEMAKKAKIGVISNPALMNWPSAAYLALYHTEILAVALPETHERQRFCELAGKAADNLSKLGTENPENKKVLSIITRNETQF